MGLGEEKKDKGKNIAFKIETEPKNNEDRDDEEFSFFTRNFKQFVNKNRFNRNPSRPLDRRRNNKPSENSKYFFLIIK